MSLWKVSSLLIATLLFSSFALGEVKEHAALCKPSWVYDGDTIRCDIYLGYGVTLRSQKIRLLGIDTPELRGDERERGLEVRDFLRARLSEVDGYCVIRGSGDKGKYGRWLGTLVVDGVDMNQLLLDKGFAKPYP